MADVPPEWRLLTSHAVGGLCAVGFASQERYLLVISSNGRGLWETTTGDRVARDREPPGPERSWFDVAGRFAEVLPPADAERVPISGIWGGHLPTRTGDGWSVVLDHEGPSGSIRERVVLAQERRPERWVIESPISEVHCMGFSPSGAVLVVASSSDLVLFRRAATSRTHLEPKEVEYSLDRTTEGRTMLLLHIPTGARVSRALGADDALFLVRDQLLAELAVAVEACFPQR